MEGKKRDYDQVSEQKTLKRSSYNNRKECIKKKTMELATLCGIDACTIIYGAHGEIESWPENPTEAKAIIKKFKDLMNNTYKRTTVRDESQKKVLDVPGEEVVSCQDNSREATANIKNFEYLTDIPCQRTTIRDESTKKVFAEPDGEVHSWLQNPRSSNIRKRFQENGEIVNIAEMVGRSSLCMRRSSLTGYQEEFLKQLDSKLEALIKKIEFLRSDQQYDTNRCSVENKQLDYSEKTSPKRMRICQAPLFPFDLNYPPPDEPQCSSLSPEDHVDLHL